MGTSKKERKMVHYTTLLQNLNFLFLFLVVEN